MYPRLAGWHDAPGTTPVTALNVVAKNEGETLREWVSVLRGAAREVNDPIAEVVVGIDASVAVDGLQRVGLQPVTFSATRFAAPALHVPRMDSRVAGLGLEPVEPVIEPTPSYLITVRNGEERRCGELAHRRAGLGSHIATTRDRPLSDRGTS